MLKIVEIGIIQLPKGKNVMKQQVLKVLANPARIFYVPYNLAVFNFAVQFFLFFGLFIVRVLVLGIKYYAAVDFYKLPLLFSFLASLMPKQRTIDVSTTLARISHTLACPGVDISTDSAPKK